MLDLAGVRLTEELGRGSRGVVYRGEARGQEVAVKLPLEHGPEAWQRFRREGALLASVRHPAVARVFDLGEGADGRPYLVTELVQGSTLASQLTRGPQSTAQVLGWLRPLVGALETLHQRGLVHRDVKPANILLSSAGASLIDFGLAVRSEGDDPAAGTLLYASPEQSGMLKRPVDGRSDLYSLGVVLFESLSGRPPFTPSNPGELMRQHLVLIPPELTRLVPGVSPVLAAITARLLRKDPDERYPSARSLEADLGRLEELEAFCARNEPPPLATLNPPPREPLVGRQAQLTRLREEWQKVRQGKGSALLLEGPAGRGKTRLLQEFLAGLPPGTVFQGFCRQEGTPFAALRGAIERGLRQPSESRARAAVRSAGSHTPALAGFTPQLDSLLGTPAGPAVLPEELQKGLAAWWIRMAEAEPLVLVLEDLHWLDPASLEVLLRLAQELHRAPLFLVATTRQLTEDGERLGRELPSGAWERLTLESLDRRELAELARGVLGPGEVDGALIDQLVQKTDRTPLGAREFLRAALDQAVLLPRWAGWECDREALLRLELPSDILELMLLRLRQLEPEVARVLAYAALLGLTFDPWSLERLFGTPARDALAAGRMAQLLDQCTFVHDRVREAAASSLTEPERLQACLELARVLQPVARSLEDWYRVSRLFWEGEASPQELRDSHRTAGLLALRGYAYEAAYQLLSRLDTEGDGELLEALGEAAHATRRRSESLQALEKAVSIEADPLRRAHLRLKRCEVGLVSYDWSQILPEAREALREAGAWVPTGGLAGLGRAVAGLLTFAARDALDRPVATRSPERHRVLCRLYDLFARGCMYAGNPLAVLESASLSALHGLKLEPCQEKTGMYCFLVAMGMLSGAHPVGLYYVRKAEDTARQAGNPVAVAQSQMFLGLTRLLQGRVREAEALLTELLTQQEGWLAPSDHFMCTQLLALGMLPRGRYLECLRWAELYEQRRRVANPDEPPSLPLLAMRLTAEAALGRVTNAEGQLERLLSDAAPNMRALGHGARLLALIHQGDLSRLRLMLTTEHELALRDWQARPAAVGIAWGWKELCLGAEKPAAEDMRALELAVQQILRLRPNTLLLSHAYHCQATLERLRGNLKAAEKCLDRAGRLADKEENDLAQLEIWLERARLARTRGQTPVAQRYARAAQDLARSQSWVMRLRHVMREFSLLETGSQPRHTGGSSGHDLERLRLERQLAALLDLSLASARVVDPAVLAQNVLDHLLSLLGAERACLFRLRDGALEEVAGRDHEGHYLERLTGYSRSLVEEVARTGQPAVVSAGQNGPVDSSSSMQIHGLKSMLAAPLFLREEPVGVLYLDTRLARGLFTDEDAALLTALGAHIAVSLETARAVEMELLYKAESQQRELAETVRDLATSLTETLEADQVWERLLGVIREHLQAAAAGLEPGVTLAGGLPELPSEEALRRVIEAGTAQREGALWLVPLGSSVLAVSRAEPLDEAELDLVATFAGQAALALEKARLFAEVMRLATTDGLTGISNRRHFFSLAERELSRASRHDEPLSAILLDVDHFKKFNDTYGHDVGDDVLKVVASTLSATIRREDLVARYGGEEFVLLLPRTAGKEALEVAAERLRAAVEEVRVRESLQVTISLGVAGLLPGETLHDLLLRADAALYESKRAGRNRATLAD